MIFSLLDASLNVKSGVIDIQGNTFESFTGKPFINLETVSERYFPMLLKNDSNLII